MAFYFTVERDNKWEVLYSHVNGETLIATCKTEKKAEDIIELLEKEETDA